MMTEACGATNCTMMEVGGATRSMMTELCGGTSRVMMKVYDATSWRSQSYDDGMWRY